MSDAAREAEALGLAYMMLRGLPAAAQDRALAWLTHRLDEDARGVEAAEHAGIEPTDAGHAHGAAMSGSREAEALGHAYLMLRGLPLAAQHRALAWLTDRFDEDARGREAAQHAGIEPTDWIVGGRVDGPSYPSRESLANARFRFGTILEAIGRAPVRQCFAVYPPRPPSRDVAWFDTHAEAERHRAQLRVDYTPPADPLAEYATEPPTAFLPDHLGA